jgi:nucleotide-binding universal stress UspA family protein
MLPKIDRILYATGLGPAAPYVFRYALSLAQQYDAQIIAVHGMEPLPAFAQSLVELHISHDHSEEMHRQARQKAKERLQERIERLCSSEPCFDGQGQGRVSAIHIVEGQPSEVILQVAAESGADIIVMGSHRHTVLGNALLGTTTNKVLHGAARPVLVVRIPEGYREEGF